jgi:SNF family Na+-dependent transporter
MLLQCRDFESASEVFPVAGFASLLTIASFSISWARVNPPLATLAEVKRVKRASLDLLIATGLTLTSACLLRLTQDPLLNNSPLTIFILVLHLLSLGLGLLLGWIAFSALLIQAVIPAADPKPDASI